MRRPVGDDDAWFRQALVGADCRLEVRCPLLGEALPRRLRADDATWAPHRGRRLLPDVLRPGC